MFATTLATFEVVRTVPETNSPPCATGVEIDIERIRGCASGETMTRTAGVGDGVGDGAAEGWSALEGAGCGLGAACRGVVLARGEGAAVAGKGEGDGDGDGGACGAGESAEIC